MPAFLDFGRLKLYLPLRCYLIRALSLESNVPDSSHSNADTPLSLLERLRSLSSSNQAYGDFSLRYSTLLRQWCVYWGMQSHDVDDVVQDTMIEVISGLREFQHQGIGSFRGWMRTIARRCWLRIQRGQNRLGSNAEEDQKIFSTLAYEDLAINFDQEAQRELVELAMSKVRQRVNPQTWQAFQLLVNESKSGAEVTKLTGLSRGSVYMAKARVQKMIMQELQELDPESAANLSLADGGLSIISPRP